ncbi:MAG TPA: nucleoside monophosphate kinase [Candidatus Paceibacterota bacterium]|nr:nucleoside monophosphate kinase [Candidatus Paceibacterota bacterium]
MKGINFPVFKTKTQSNPTPFSMDDPEERKKYFSLKAGDDIKKLKEYLESGTFVGFLMGKKNSGKGTYSKLFAEAVGPDKIKHISIGDIVRDVHEDFDDPIKKEELMTYLEKNYRGFMSLNEALDALFGRSTSKLLPTELILALVKREIDKAGRKALFIDGFPRNLDQISYSIYFRELMGYRDDPDFFVFIDVPEAVIDERMKYRVVCPICHVPRGLKLLRTNKIGYDEEKKEFYLICDNPNCGGPRMVPKEGDSLGIEAIRDRIEVDDAVMRTLMKLEGVPKIFLRNSVPADTAKDVVDDYEITPAYKYEYNKETKEVKVIEESWSVLDENGDKVFSLLPAPVVVSLISQIVKALGL